MLRPTKKKEEKEGEPKGSYEDKIKHENAEIKQEIKRSSGRDIILLLFVTVIAIITRTINIYYPNAVLFDEAHFISMAQYYIQRKHFFDIHPPLGKLILAAVGYYANLDFSSYRDIGIVFKNDAYIYMRAVPAIFGSLLAPLAFSITKKLGGTPFFCVMTSFLIILELSFQTISRCALLDPLLYFFIAFGLNSALNMWKIGTQGSTFFYWFWTLLCGISLGCAFSVKHTGLGIIGIVGVVHFIINIKESLAFFKRVRRYRVIKACQYFFFGRIFRSGLLLILLIILVYFFVFWIHFNVIKYSGKDDLIMSASYRSFLVNTSIPDQIVTSRDKFYFFKYFTELNKKMLSINNQSLFYHYHGSPWYEWPVHFKGIVYFWQDINDEEHILVYLFGNPIIYWTALLSVILSTFFLLSKLVRFSSFSQLDKGISLCVFGYFVNWLPYYYIGRTTYIYHYHPSLYFAIILIGLLFDKISRTLHVSSKIVNNITKILFVLLMLSIIYSYFFFLPFSYALPLTDEAHESRRWFKAILPYW